MKSNIVALILLIYVEVVFLNIEECLETHIKSALELERYEIQLTSKVIFETRKKKLINKAITKYLVQWKGLLDSVCIA